MTPTTRERKALLALRPCQWEHVASLSGVGAGTLKSMLDNGWIEMLPNTPSGLKRCKITDAGVAALDEPVPKPLRRPPLKMIEPRLKILDTRTVKPRG